MNKNYKPVYRNFFKINLFENNEDKFHALEQKNTENKKDKAA